MTTLTTHPLAIVGFTQDLEACNPHSQLAWYANDAEVSIVEWGQPTRSPHILRGKVAIGSWIAHTCSENRAVRVVYHAQRHDEMTLIAESRKQDGTLGIYSCTAQLQRGLIVNQFVVLL